MQKFIHKKYDYRRTIRKHTFSVTCNTLSKFSQTCNSNKLTEGYVISDEIYSQLVYEGKPAVSIAKYFCLNTAKQANGVVVISGAAFGAPSHIRISLASNQIKEDLDRFALFIKNCK